MKTSTTIAFAAALMATTANAAPVAGINIGDYVRVTGQNAIYNVEAQGVSHMKTWNECVAIGAACTSPKAITAADLAALELELGHKRANNCWNAMGNQYVDLKNAFCAGGDCDTTEEAKKLEDWWPSSVAFESGGRVEGRSCPALYRSTYVDWCWNKMGNTYPDLKNAFCAGGACDTKEEAKKLSNWYPSSIQYESGGRWAGKSCHEEADEELQILTYKAKFTRYIPINNSSVYTLTNQYGDTKICEVDVGYYPQMWCVSLEGRVSITGLPQVQEMHFSDSKNLKAVDFHDAKNREGQSSLLTVAKGVTCGAGLNCRY